MMKIDKLIELIKLVEKHSGDPPFEDPDYTEYNSALIWLSSLWYHGYDFGVREIEGDNDNEDWFKVDGCPDVDSWASMVIAGERWSLVRV